MRDNDEFNVVKVNNESKQPSFEFGNTQNQEFSSYRDNPSTHHRDELNPNENSNNENVQVGQTQTNNNDIIAKATEANSGATEAINVSTSTATTAATASTTAASTVGHIAVGATVIAVTAVSTVAGISVISKNNATVNINDLSIGETTLVYYLNLNDSEGDPFSIIVENDNFRASKPLEEGMNEGNFENLNANTQYRLYIKEQNDNQKVIYDTYFTTKEHEEEPVYDTSEFYLAYFQDANYADYTFKVGLSYFDEQNNLSDFSITFTDIENSSNSHTYELEKTTELQTLSGMNEMEEIILDIRDHKFEYRVDYMQKGEAKYFISETYIIFEDTSGYKSEFRGVEISEYANFATFTFDVSLDVVDDFGYMHSFVIYMTNVKEEPAETEYTVELRLGMIEGPQTFDYSELNPEEPGLICEKQFKFRLEYVDRGEDVVVDLGTRGFIDNSATMRAPTISPAADFAELTFDITLDYDDEFSQIDGLSLKMTSQNEGVPVYIPLDHTLDTQTISYYLYGNEPYRLRQDVFDFEIIWSQKGKEMTNIEVNNISFEDKLNREPSVEIEINPACDMVAYSFDINLTVVNPFNNLTDGVLVMYTGTISHEFPVELVSGTQTISCLGPDDEEYIDLAHDSFNWTLAYYIDGNLGQIFSEEPIGFYDYNYNAAMYVPHVDDGANFADNSIRVKLNYTDVYDENFSNFQITLTSTTISDNTETVSLTKTRRTQDVYFDRSIVNLADGEYECVITYDQGSNHDIEAYNSNITFSNRYESRFNPETGFNCDFKVLEFLGENPGEEYYVLPFYLYFDDSAIIYRAFYLTIDDDTPIELMSKYGSQILDFTPYSSLINDGNEHTLKLSCLVHDYATETQSEELFATKTGEFTLQSESRVFGASVPENALTYMSTYFDLTLCIYDPSENFSNYQLVVEDPYNYRAQNTNNVRYYFDIDTSGIDMMYEGLTGVDVSASPYYEEVRSIIENGPINLYIRYYDAQDEEYHEIQFINQMQFVLIA